MPVAWLEMSETLLSKVTFESLLRRRFFKRSPPAPSASSPPARSLPATSFSFEGWREPFDFDDALRDCFDPPRAPTGEASLWSSAFRPADRSAKVPPLPAPPTAAPLPAPPAAAFNTAPRQPSSTALKKAFHSDFVIKPSRGSMSIMPKISVGWKPVRRTVSIRSRHMPVSQATCAILPFRFMSNHLKAFLREPHLAARTYANA
mmetsp:Transcript_29699/g.75251  ORF Transcript_29699/g.75251 Transcript_29699/m.75251 type:complete len:204 (+) Transcript_29699:219-830(+)